MYAIIDESLQVAIEPYSGVVAEMDNSNVVVNLATIVDKIDRLEDIANDLLASLNPMTTPLISHPDRGGIYLDLGKVTNFIYGFITGLLISALVLGVRL